MSEEKEQPKKFCPMDQFGSFCHKKECGFWNTDMQMCGIAALGNLPLIVEELHHIEYKLTGGA